MAPGARRPPPLEWEHDDPFDRPLLIRAMREKRVFVHANAAIRGLEPGSQLWGTGRVNQALGFAAPFRPFAPFVVSSSSRAFSSFAASA